MTAGSSLHTYKDSKYTSSTAKSTPPPHHWELEQLDQRLQHITDAILPTAPYLLKLYSDRPFKTSALQEADLLRYTPFHAGEEQLQYSSFSAIDLDDSLITRVGGWEDDKPDDRSQSSHSQKMQSANGTPKLATKKISINEYRKRAAGQPGMNGALEANGDTTHEDTRPDERGTSNKQNNLRPSQGSKELKRSIEELIPKDASGLQQNQDAPQPKKPRNSLAPNASIVKDAGSIKRLSLPGPISPTLPPLFEKKLAEVDDVSLKDSKVGGRGPLERSPLLKSKPSTASEKASSGALKDRVDAKKPLSKEASSAASGKTPQSEATKQISNGAGSSKAAKDATNSSAHLPSPNIGLPNSRVGSKTAEKFPTEPKQRESMIVRLKIPRSIRKRVSRLLQLKPQPKPGIATKNKADNDPMRDRSASIKREPQPASIRDDRDLVKSKEERNSQRDRARSNAAEPSNKPSTKKRLEDTDLDSALSQNRTDKYGGSRSPPSFRSPILSSRAGLKRPRDLTPAISVKEETVSTPQGSIRNGTPAAPSSVERPGKEARHTPSASGSSLPVSAEAHDALRNEQHRYFELGKSLKKESDQLYKAGQTENPAAPILKKYLAIRMEVTLAFMLAYVVGDEMRRIERTPLNVEKTWATLFPWLRQLQQQTIDHTYLRGLSLQLEAVCHMVAWNVELDQMASAGHDKPEGAKSLKKHHDEAQRMLIEGSSLLSVDDLQQEFPRTWRTKARAPLAQSPPKLTGTSLGGDFYLPITSITLPIEAVRAGRSLLAEWCKMEGVEWTPKLNI